MNGGRLSGRYALIRQLGSGGMGTVWLARDEMLHREVAVKELKLPDGMGEAERAEAVTRSVREAQATAQLRHPGIVMLHDVVVEQGRPWLVMELLRGRTLAETVALRGPLPPRQVAGIGADVLDALNAAHARGLQHRDVKPGNIFLTDSGRVVLTDFGIAREEGQETLTETGMMIGSPGFIAPERLRGDKGGPASDLWSLAATLYLAAEGHPPFDGSPSERIRATLKTRPRPAREPLGPVLTAMLARRVTARPGAQTVLRALRDIAAGRPTPPSLRDAAMIRERTRRRGRIWALLVITLALVVTAFVAATREAGPDVPDAFTVPVDVCTLLPAEEAAQLLKSRRPVTGRPSPDQVGPTCGWAIPGHGISLQVQTDSGIADPWSMTRQTAYELLRSEERYWREARQKVEWTWEAIGAAGAYTATSTPSRRIEGVGEEAFAFELTGPHGRVHTSVVSFRLANLVVAVRYTTLATRPTDASIKETALEAARLTEHALRRAA
ncbi:protein kinase domain-containing protein [Nonomuraea polychroma]|uniref:serine/threonine-protein kinase n=1 Tax=Nonomuraea polychroma TaxID=46176 RepID=UPI003D8F3FFC